MRCSLQEGRRLNGTAPDGLTASRENGLGAGRVGEIQRARLLAAMTELACERGAGNVTVAHVVARAGVSRRTFYEVFEDRGACLLAALDEALARASRCVLDVYDPHAKWDVRVRTALIALLGFLDVERGAGWLLIVGSLGAGPRALERHKRVLAGIATVIDGARKEAKGSGGPPPLTAEGIVGAVLSVLHARLVDGDRAPLLGLTGQLMSMIVLPYLGPVAARRELARRVREVSAHAPLASSNPLKDLQMRLTYRTVRVLGAVATYPGSSNRVIADAAEVGDQGQISKLLARLERLGLIEKGDNGSAAGVPNAWRLTERGEEVHFALAGQTARP